MKGKVPFCCSEGSPTFRLFGSPGPVRRRCGDLLSICLLVVLFVEPATACSCAEPPSVINLFMDSSAVFSGRPTAVKVLEGAKVARWREITFAVTKRWKGPEVASLQVLAAPEHWFCPGYEIGDKEYIVFAAPSSRSSLGPKLGEFVIDSICSNRLHLAERSAETIRELDSLKKVAETGCFTCDAGVDSKEKLTTPERLDAESEGSQNSARFSKAYDLIQKGDFASALTLLQQNIAETPQAVDIDYSYGWGTLCLAELGRFEEALEYYRVMQTRFYGDQVDNGRHRMWGDQLDKTKKLLQRSSHPRKQELLAEMELIDSQTYDRALADTEKLIRRAQRGDLIAVDILRSTYSQKVIDLIDRGRLRLTDR